MKTSLHQNARRKDSAGLLMTEMVVAMAILVIAIIPVGYSLIQDARWLHANYQHSIAMEVVDGEMEILAAGEWRSYPEGTQAYKVHAAAAANLPPGQFQLTRKGNQLRLEWIPTQRRGVGAVVREVTPK